MPDLAGIGEFMNPTTEHFFPWVFGLAVAALPAFAMFRILHPFLGVILWAFLLAFLRAPVNHALQRVLRDRRALVALLLTFDVILLVSREVAQNQRTAAGLVSWPVSLPGPAG
jgi:predicted PurR-regulated permease PerM